jgi:hypothetical protein
MLGGAGRLGFPSGPQEKATGPSFSKAASAP